MKAVMYGAGNIGRGFIGALFSKSGYDVVFVDVSAPVVAELNKKGRYPLRYVSGDGHTDEWIENVSAVDGNDTDAVADAVADCDIMATAVGANVLKFIAPNIAEGIRRRKASGRPLDILICENLMDADTVLDGLIRQYIGADDCEYYNKNVGLVETSIGRMVPVQTDAMKDGEPLRVCVESYGELPVDRAAFRGDIPPVVGMLAVSPFDFYIKRKLYIHNMAHAVCAYLGDIKGMTYICEAISDGEIYAAVKKAMQESAAALAAKYGADRGALDSYCDDLLARFANRALADTCARVGNDPVRKLGRDDRLIGAALTCTEQGITPAGIAAGAAAALRYLAKEQDCDVCRTLQDVSGLEREHPLTALILNEWRAL